MARLSNIFEQLEQNKIDEIKLIESFQKRYNNLKTLNESTTDFSVEESLLTKDIFEAAMKMNSFEESIEFVNRIDEGILSSIGGGLKNLWNSIKDSWNDLKGPIKAFLSNIETAYDKYIKAGNLYESEGVSFDEELYEATIAIADAADLKDYIFGTTGIFSKLDPADKLETLRTDIDKQTLRNTLTTIKGMYNFMIELSGDELKTFVNSLPSIFPDSGLQKKIGYDILQEYITKYPGKELPKNKAITDLSTLGSFVQALNHNAPEQTVSSKTTTEEKAEDNTRQKAVFNVVKKIMNDKKYDSIYEKTGTTKKAVWGSTGGFYYRLKMEDFKFVKTIIGMNKKGNTPNAAYVTFFSFVPVLWEEFMNTTYAKSDTNFHNFLKTTLPYARKLGSAISTTDLSIDGFDKGFNPDLQNQSQYTKALQDPSLKMVFPADTVKDPKNVTKITEALALYNKNDYNKNIEMLKSLNKIQITFLDFDTTFSTFRTNSGLKPDLMDLLISELLKSDVKFKNFMSTIKTNTVVADEFKAKKFDKGDILGFIKYRVQPVKK